MGKFDFNKIERKSFEITLKSGISLQVSMPAKRTFEKVTRFYDDVMGNDTNKIINVLYEICAEIISNNNEKQVITAAELELYDVEELTAFLSAYMEFVNTVKTNPN